MTLPQNVAHTAAAIIPVFVIAYLLEAQRVRSMYLPWREKELPFTAGRRAIMWTVLGPAVVVVVLVLAVPKEGVASEGGWGAGLFIATAFALIAPLVMLAYTMWKIDPQAESEAREAALKQQREEIRDLLNRASKSSIDRADLRHPHFETIAKAAGRRRRARD
ncbi:MAG: hypothetical protein V4755_11375 [Curtobacterium sp.]